MFKIYILLLILTIVYGLPIHKRSFGNVAGNNEEPQIKAVNKVWSDVFPLASQIRNFDASGLPDLIENQRLPMPNIRITGADQDAIFRDLLVTTVRNKGRLRKPDNQPEKNPDGSNLVGHYAFLHKKAFINGETMTTNDFEEGLERVNAHIESKPRFSDTDNKDDLERAIKASTLAMFKRYSNYLDYEKDRLAGNPAGMTEIDPVTGETTLEIVTDAGDLLTLAERLRGVKSQFEHAKVYGLQRKLLNTIMSKHSDINRATEVADDEIKRLAALDTRITAPPGCRKRDGCTFDLVLASFPEFKNVKIVGLSPHLDYEKTFLTGLKDVLGHPDILPDFKVGDDIEADFESSFDLKASSIFKGATTPDGAWNQITDLIIAEMDNPNSKLTKQHLRRLLGALRFAHLSRDTKLSNDQDPNPQEAASYEIQGQNINRILDKATQKYGSLLDADDDNGDNDMSGFTSTGDDKIVIKEYRNAFDQHSMDKSDALRALSTVMSNKVKIPTDDDVVDDGGEGVIPANAIIPEATDDISLWSLAADYFIAELKEDMPSRQFKRLRLFLAKFASAINNLDKSIEQKIKAGIPISMEEFTSYKAFREDFERCKGIYTKFDKNIVLRKPEIGDPDKDPDTGDTIIYFDVPDTKSEMPKFTPEGRNKARDTKAFKRNTRTSSTKKPIKNGRSNTTKNK